MLTEIVPKGKYGEHRDGSINGQPKRSDSPVKGDSEYEDVFLEVRICVWTVKCTIHIRTPVFPPVNLERGAAPCCFSSNKF